MEWPEELSSAGITPSVLVFFVAFIVILLYLFFFQQYLTALFYKGFLKLILPKSLTIHFERFSFSMFTGQFTLHRVQIINQDMKINIGRVRATLFYWRPIPTYVDDEGKSYKVRFHAMLNAVEITIYNRQWSTEMVEKINEKINGGATAEDITNFLREQYPAPVPYPLALIYRAILPFSFEVKAFSFTVGNNTLPSFVVAQAQSLNGKFSIITRENPQSHIKSRLEMQLNNFKFLVLPHPIEYPPIFATSMRDINERSQKIRNVIVSETVNVSIQNDLPGCYVMYDDHRELGLVTQDPRQIIDVQFVGNTTLEYGPYTDKLRVSFMKFFLPFYFNNPVIYQASDGRIKNMEVNITFVDGFTFTIPFVTQILSHDSLIVAGSEGSTINVLSSQFPTTIDECKMTVSAEIKQPIISTSYGVEQIITADQLNVEMGNFYKEHWYDVTQTSVYCKFDNSHILLHPYHIDFFTALGTDWASWYPFQTVPDTASNFFPWNYYVVVDMAPVTAVLLMEKTPAYSQVHSPNEHSRLEIKLNNLVFRLTAPFTEYQAEKKGVTFTVDLMQGGAEFVRPGNHLLKIRRGTDINNYLTFERLFLKGEYRWSSIPGGDASFPLTIQIYKATGLSDFSFIFSILDVIQNYTVNKRRVPEELQELLDKNRPTVTPYKFHISVVLSIDKGTLKVPYQMYDTHNCAVGTLNKLLLTVESCFPYWQVLMNIDSVVANLPPTDIPYEVFYKEQIGDKEMKDAVGLVHMDGMAVEMRAISEKPGLTTSSDIAVFIGKIAGFALLPHILHGLEVTTSFIYHWFSEDSKDRESLDQWYFYMLRNIRVCMQDVTLYVDMGQLGILSAQLPSGVCVFLDNLIDDKYHTHMYAILPSIDVIHLIQEYDNGPLIPCFRTTLYLNVNRNGYFSGNKEDKERQAELLRQFDKNLKRYPFLWNEIPDLPENFLVNPEIFDQNAFNADLKEEIDLSQELASNPFENGEYTLEIPVINYNTKKLFCTPERLAMWCHHFRVVRFYTHRFDKILTRDLGTEILDPHLMTEENRVKFSKINMDMYFCIPHNLIVNITPVSIPLFAALIEMMNYKSNSMLLDAYTRSMISAFTRLEFHRREVIGLFMPKITVNLLDENYVLTVLVDEIKLYLDNYHEQHYKKLSLVINEVSVNCYDLEKEQSEPDIALKVPQILVATSDDKSKISVGHVTLDLQPTSPKLISTMGKSLKVELSGLPKPIFGQRMDDFFELIKTSNEYQSEKKRLREFQFQSDMQFMNPDYNADITAMYTAAAAMDLMNFNIHFKNVSSKEETSEINDEISKKFNISLPPLTVIFSDPMGESVLKINPYPISIDSKGKTLALTSGIRSLSLRTGPPILKFIEAIKAVNEDNQFDTVIEDIDEESQKEEKQSGRTKIYAHIVVNNINLQFQEISLTLQKAAVALTHNPYLMQATQFSFTGSINDLCLRISDMFVANFKSFSLCQRSESLEGALRIGPIDIDFPVTFVLNLVPNLEKSLGFNLNENKALLMPRKRSSIKRDSFKVEDVLDNEEKENDNNLLKEILDALNVTVLIEPITLTCILDQDVNFVFQLPAISGLASNEENALTFFTFIHEPIISVSNIFSVQIAPLLLHGSFNVQDLQLLIFLMLGQINIVGNGESLSSLLILVNSILGRMEKKVIKEIKKKKEQTIPLRETKKSTQSKKLNVNFQFLMPQISVSFPEISMIVGLEALFVNLELAKALSFEAQIQGFFVQLFEATLTMEFYASFMNNILKFTMSDPTANFSQIFFANINKLVEFGKAIQHRVKRQKKVKKLFKDLNKTIAKAADQGAGILLNSMGFEFKEKEEDALAFPDLIDLQLFFEIRNTSVSISLQKSGECHLQIPIVSLCVQTRISEQHKKTAYAAVFCIKETTLVLDSAESTSTTTGASSDAFEGTMRSNNDDNNNLSLISLKQVDLNLISFQNKVSLEASIAGLKIKLFPTFPSAIVRIIEVVDLSGITPTSSSQATTESEFEEEEDDNETQIVTQNEEEKKIDNLEIDTTFRCLDTELVLYPIANSVPVPKIILKLLLKEKHAYVVVNIPNDVKATFSPLLIDWIMKLLKTLKTTPKQNISQSPQLSTPRSSQSTPKRLQATPPSKRRSNPATKAQSSSQTLLMVKDQIEQKIKIDLIVNTKLFEICLSCKPRRSDVSAVVGFNSLQIMHSSTTNATNASLINIYLRTHNIYTPTNSYARTARLFELNIPRIDASLLTNDLPIAISKIEVSISSDKIEEISLFNDVWVQPLLKVFQSDETEETTVKAPKPDIPQEITTNNDTNPIKLKLMLNSFDLYFNYTSGAGNLLLKLYPIRAELSKQFIFLSVNSISLNSFGRLTSEIELSDIYFQRETPNKKNSKLLFMLKKISVDMRSMEDQFLTLSVGRINLITRSSVKKSGPYSILLASLDSPVLSATAQTVPNLLSFYHTVADPIMIGVQRANRTTVSSTKPKTVTNQIVKSVHPPNSRLVFVTSGAKVELFRYYFKDSEAIRLTVAGVNLSLAISTDEMERIARNMNFAFKPIVLGKLIMNTSKPTLREILKLPEITGDLDTVQIGVNGTTIHYDFVTNFDGLIEPTLTLTDYEFLVDLLKYASKQLNMDSLASSSSSPKEEPKKKIQYTFVPNKYSFNPGFKVGIGASLKPNVQWLLTQLGISDEHIIPASLFEAVSLGLEKLLISVTD
ncbi:hypothetical protein TVAG_407970 [Trichomonas vaginalis G3]|uniref:Uncharacterized protein n=1 Tax=Trichomonas vaginalis (strain ATCC PRA-98 / G3) TaxID=412133 RepID=A2FNM8_TRIV3|nr:protein CSF1 family [Trichomonas vaginalis G3]EAX93496.1 hypothetical protein TVAG_407970 [Trichomonas vaginalis G3]KAI5533642.1 protein CSF1 family [Trichomonas vaginalis G3]|eukprot:XP_001306426.1 hypothetical protein [Trichomonas vaginalis G3]